MDNACGACIPPRGTTIRPEKEPISRASPVYDQSVVKRLATQMGWTPPGASPAALTDDDILIHADDVGLPALASDTLIISFARALLSAAAVRLSRASSSRAEVEIPEEVTKAIKYLELVTRPGFLHAKELRPLSDWLAAAEAPKDKP